MAPPTQGTPVTLRIPPDVLARIDARANQAGVSRAEWMRRVLAAAAR